MLVQFIVIIATKDLVMATILEVGRGILSKECNKDKG